MRGRDVFQPIGFESFGIHTENFAILDFQSHHRMIQAIRRRCREGCQAILPMDVRATINTSGRWADIRQSARAAGAPHLEI